MYLEQYLERETNSDPSVAYASLALCTREPHGLLHSGVAAWGEVPRISPSCRSISISIPRRLRGERRTDARRGVFSISVLLREVRVPAGEEHGGDGVGHDVGGLVADELLEAHGSDGEAGAHLVPDLFPCEQDEQKRARLIERNETKNKKRTLM